MQRKREYQSYPRPATAGRNIRGPLVTLVIGSLLLMAAACNTPLLTVGQAAGQLQDRFWASVRTPSGETERLLRNARFLKMVGRTQLALKDMEEAYQHDPGNLQVVDALAQCYEELGAWQRAEELYRQALARDQDNQALANNLCYSYYQAGNWAKAESCFREALKRNPKNIAARNNLGLLLARQGRQTEALALWRETEGDAKATERLNLALGALGQPATPLAQAAKPAPSPQATAKVETKAAAPAPPPQPAVTQTTPAAKPEAAPFTVAAANHPQTANTVESVVVKPPQEARPPAAVAPAPVATAPPPGQPAKPVMTAKSEDQPAPDLEKKPAQAPTPEAVAPATAAPPAPKPTEVKPPVQPQKKGLAGTPAPAPVKEEPLPILSSQEMINTRLEVLNGNGVKGTAAQSRTWLNLEGFTVAEIGNYKDFGLQETVVSYRPGAERVARVLAGKFYQTKTLKPNPKLPPGIEVRIVLGQDQKPRQAQIGQLIAALEAKAAALGDLASAPQPAAPAAQKSGRGEAAAAAKTVPVPGQPPLLTAEELTKTSIELRNGNGAQDQARQSRSLLSLEGFNVVGIKNHIDFGLDQTLIAFRPGSEKVAQALAARFFQSARLEEAAKLPEGVDVKVVLGRDFTGHGEVLAKLTD